MAENFCKYYKLVRQVSYNSGQTWSNVDPPQYQQGDLYETYSSDCAPQLEYRWKVLDESETICENGIGHYVEYKQVSGDYGETWENVVPEETQLGAEKTLEESMDCFKFHCNNGSPYINQYWDDCDGEEDIYLLSSDIQCESYYSHKTPSIPDYDTGQYDVYIGNCVGTLMWIRGGNDYTDGTFSRCYHLVRCILPETLHKIGKYCFFQCISLKSIDIPDSVTDIENNAFQCCRSLEKVKLPSGLTSISDYTFAGRYSDGTSYSEIIGINQLKSIGTIGSGASVEIPNSVTSIGEGAFYWCQNLSAITIPNSVTSIGADAFRRCSGVTNCIIGSGVTSIGASAFYECSSLPSISIPNSVTSIGDFAFFGCNSLPVTNSIRYADTYAVLAVDKTLSAYTLKNGTKWIGSGAFDSCDNLTSMDIPNGVISIGAEAFYSCDSLTSVTIPSTITSIGNDAFHWCDNLTNATIYAITHPNIGWGVFEARCIIYVPAESVEAYRTAGGYWDEYSSRIQPIP